MSLSKVMKFKRIDQVVNWRLCSGCGACASVCPAGAIHLIDILEHGIRPVVDSLKCQVCSECVKVCPGIEISHDKFDSRTIPQLHKAWGPVLEVWEGYAADGEIRFKASSGGAATALALFCLEKENFSGVLHIGASLETPLRNVPVFSRDRGDLLACTGSRYSPAAPCEKLNWIEESDSPCVFIGKPCDVVALRKSQALSQDLNDKVCLAISIFCAGTPSSKGTLALLREVSVEASDVDELRYRGCGWPGKTTVKLRNTNPQMRQISYEQSWGKILSHYSQFRCRLCPDGTGEFADISCGDPWYRPIGPDEPGYSLVLVRTELGRKILRRAMEAGYIELERARPEVLAASQKALLNKRQNLFGRLLSMRLMRVPVPRYTGFSLFRNWLELRPTEKMRSFGGTLRRIAQRKWTKPLEVYQTS